MVVTGIPYAVEGIGQFKTRVYAVFSRQGTVDVLDENEKGALVADFFRLNQPLAAYVRGYVERVRTIARLAGPTLDDGFSLAILYQPGSADQPHGLEMEYGRRKLSQYEAPCE
jgi:hypothetical protein